tara:strand:- start:85 stop:204 length:120 start_codon:yes stop_codon:yes gene_type:complete
MVALSSNPVKTKINLNSELYLEKTSLEIGNYILCGIAKL